MKIIIRDEYENEGVLVNNADSTYYGLFLGGWAVIWHIVIFVWNGFTFKSQFLWLLFTSPLILAGIFLIISDKETVVIDKKLQNVITDKHLFWRFHEIEKVSLANIKEVKIIYSNTGEGGWFCYTDLITTKEKSIRLKSDSVTNPDSKYKENAKKFGIKICELIGVDGQHIDTNGKSTPLIGGVLEEPKPMMREIR